MNYRLQGYKPKKDFPKSIHYAYKNTSVTLNEIVERINDDDILKFDPYRTLVFYSRNIDIFITVDKLEEFLSSFGYEYNAKEFEKKNVSEKRRGTFNEATRNRIANLYADDMNLFRRVIIVKS